ncbi:MAG: 50S ribosomal protein L11 methyltransferase, partial [Candidatus Rokubacteria bacterium]|nr:50S ribosomal protein L11 methyltransferase [Candidatus Rokubacteria bacterium]
MAAGGAATPAPWWELTIPATSDITEGLTNRLWELGALGVLEEEIAGDRPRLRAFFPATAAPDTLLADVSDYVGALEALGFRPAGAPHVTPLADGAWADAWREHFRPVAVGRRLVIVPPWIANADRDRLAIVIEPGRAFGTGHHGSTAGCLVAVERIVARDAPAYALDLGTGSGILAIAAARLGVPRVVGIDDDPDAIAVATVNATRNGVADRVRCALGDAGALESEPAPLVAANLLSAAHHRLAARYPMLVATGGALILGGILDAEADAVEHAVARAGFMPDERISREGWTTLVLRRGGSRSATGSPGRAERGESRSATGSPGRAERGGSRSATGSPGRAERGESRSAT